MQILVTTDGSGHSVSVVYHADRLARAVGGRIVFLRILDPLVDCAGVRTTSLDTAVDDVAGRWTAEMTDRLAGMHIEGEALVCPKHHAEEIPQAILRVAGERGVACIAMASRGAGLLRHALLGSTALGVLARTRVPLLVAGDAIERPQAGADYHFLVTNDGSQDSFRAYDAVADLATAPSIRISLVRVYQPRAGDRGEVAEMASARSELEGLLHRLPEHARGSVSVLHSEKLGGVDSAILQTAHYVGATALAVATHGHSRKYHVFMGSTALGLLKDSPFPVFLVRSTPDNG